MSPEEDSDHPDPDRMARRAIASGDRPLLLGLLLLLAVAASLTPIRNYDYWWHLATGRFIVEHGSVPRADPFSFTSAGTPWVDHEWLFQVAAYLGHRACGPDGLVLMKAAGVLLIVLLFVTHLTREGHAPASAAMIVLPALLGSAFRLDVRPEIATLLLVPLALHLVLWARARGGIGPLLLVPPLVALGANLHVGIIVLPALLALGACATFVQERWRVAAFPAPQPPRFAGRLLAIAVASALFAGINPYGLRIYAVPFGVERVLASLPSPNLEWARPQLRDFPIFYAAAVLLVLVVLLGRRGIDPVATPAALVLAALSAAHLRSIGLFFLILPYGVARPLLVVIERARRAGAGAASAPAARRAGAGGRSFRPGFIAAAALLVAGIPALHALPPGVVWGLGVASDNEPARAADFLEREGVGEKLFNDVRFGGYLIWRRYPGRQAFIDGRNEVHAILLREIFAALKDSRSWEALLDRHRIDAAFLRYPPSLQKVLLPPNGEAPPRTTERAFAAVYFPKERWALVYWDDDAMILLRRSEQYKDVIARLEYRAIHPDDWRYLYAGVLAGRLSADSILEELQRKMAEDPGCGRARALLASFARLRDSLAASGAGAPAGPG